MGDEPTARHWTKRSPRPEHARYASSAWRSSPRAAEERNFGERTMGVGLTIEDLTRARRSSSAIVPIVMAPRSSRPKWKEATLTAGDQWSGICYGCFGERRRSLIHRQRMRNAFCWHRLAAGFVLVAMSVFNAMVLRPELAEAASRQRGKETAATLTGRWSWRASCPGGQYLRCGLYRPA
jgi:hypothetical protein